MPAWYDILTLGPRGRRRTPTTSARSAAEVDALLAREKERGVARRTGPCSPGSARARALALHAGVRHPETLAGILVLSGYEVLPETREAEAAPANRRTPMLFCHGTQDPLVPVARRPRGLRRPTRRRTARRSGASSPWRTRSRDEEIEVFRGWLHARLMIISSGRALTMAEDR